MELVNGPESNSSKNGAVRVLVALAVSVILATGLYRLLDSLGLPHLSQVASNFLPDPAQEQAQTLLTDYLQTQLAEANAAQRAWVFEEYYSDSQRVTAIEKFFCHPADAETLFSLPRTSKQVWAWHIYKVSQGSGGTYTFYAEVELENKYSVSTYRDWEIRLKPRSEDQAADYCIEHIWDQTDSS